MVAILEAIAVFRGYPEAVRTDQGPEFTGKALDQWAYDHGVILKLIQAGKPTQNAYIESFNGKQVQGRVFKRASVQRLEPCS